MRPSLPDTCAEEVPAAPATTLQIHAWQASFGGPPSVGQGMRENKKYYERTRQVTENIHIPFLEFAGSRLLIENKHDTVIMPSGC